MYRTTVRVDTTEVYVADRTYSNIFGFETNALSVFIRTIVDTPEDNIPFFTGNTVSVVRDVAMESPSQTHNLSRSETTLSIAVALL